MNLVEQFWQSWPWMGLGAAVVVLILLFGTDLMRAYPTCPRRRDVYWLAWLPVPAYLIHQFEEYSCHTTGEPAYYSIVQFFYDVGGFGPLSLDNIPLAHFALMNIVFVWLAIPLGAFLARRWSNPVVGLTPYGFMLFNALTHVAGGVAGLVGPWYASPGIYTGILLFVPLTVGACRAALHEGTATGRDVATALASGTLGHIALFGAYALCGVAGPGAMLAWDVLVGFVPLILAVALSRKAAPRS